MGSFLQKLKGGSLVGSEKQTGSVPKKYDLENINQLPVDVCRSDNEIIIYAQISGTDIDKLDVSIEGDNDIITIQGEQTRLENLILIKPEPEEGEGQQHNEGENVQINVRSSPLEGQGKFLFKECVWGQFFRQIVLPQKVDSGRASAKVKDGVLVLQLPFKKPSDNKVRMKIVKFDDCSHE